MKITLTLNTSKALKKPLNILYNKVSPEFKTGSHGITHKHWSSVNDGESVVVIWTFETESSRNDFMANESIQPLIPFMTIGE